MGKNNRNIKILLVCDNKAYCGNIKFRLENSIETSCYVWHGSTLCEALDLLNNKKLRADIIILDLGLIGSDSPINIYNEMGKAAPHIPIIALTGTGSEERDLAVLVMEAGAADHMVRGQFSRLMDAIEFSLIRHKIKGEAVAEALMQPQKIIQDAHIKESETKSDDISSQRKQYISWMTGGYSVEDNS